VNEFAESKLNGEFLIENRLGFFGASGQALNQYRLLFSLSHATLSGASLRQVMAPHDGDSLNPMPRSI
jgi:hypothetical protein